MKSLLLRHQGSAISRRLFFDFAIVTALLLAGGLCGIGARAWIGGLKTQHVQLERCILASRQSHSNEDPHGTLTHLDAAVPACMYAAGYEQALSNQHCSPAFWQGDVFCYLPKSSLGKIGFHIEAAQAHENLTDESNHDTPRRAGG